MILCRLDPALMILLDGHTLTLDQLAAIAYSGADVGIAPAAAARVRRARAVVDRHASGTAAVYGINTGFGSLSEIAIPRDKLDRSEEHTSELQSRENL